MVLGIDKGSVPAQSRQKTPGTARGQIPVRDQKVDKGYGRRPDRVHSLLLRRAHNRQTPTKPWRDIPPCCHILEAFPPGNPLFHRHLHITNPLGDVQASVEQPITRQKGMQDMTTWDTVTPWFDWGLTIL